MSKLIFFVVLFAACAVSKHSDTSPHKELMPSGDTLFTNKWDSLYILRRNGDTTFIVLPEDIENAKH